MSGPRSNLGWLLTALVIIALVALDVPQRMVSGVSFAAESGRLQAVRQELTKLDDSSNTFREIARGVRDGVVQIRVAPSEATLRRVGQLAESAAELDEKISAIRQQDGSARELEQLLERRREIQEERERLADRSGRGTGSGIVYDESGHILTNNHVVAERGRIDVRLADGRQFVADVVGLDPKSDLAVIKVAAERLRPLTLGDSDQADVGDWVLAVGAPFGLSQTVTHGIISAKGRQDIFTGRRDLLYQNFMQTDAAINPGNSGGPLVNLRGEVIGVNTAIAANEDGVNAGIAFTIPSNYARKIADQLRSNGAVARGWLGVSLFEPQDFGIAPTGDESESPAIYVNAVHREGPAFKAGLLCDDQIVSINDIPVSTVRQLQSAIADISPGQKARLNVRRDGQAVDIQVELGRQPENLFTSGSDAQMEFGRPVNELALLVRTLSDQLPFRLRSVGDRALIAAALTHRARSGVLVVGTTGGDYSATYSLSAGDAIVAVNGNAMKTVGDLIEAIKSSKSTVELRLVDPSGDERTIEMKKR